jgi:hypothetical protein
VGQPGVRRSAHRAGPATNRNHPDSDPYRVEATNIEIDVINELK